MSVNPNPTQAPTAPVYGYIAPKDNPAKIPLNMAARAGNATITGVTCPGATVVLPTATTSTPTPAPVGFYGSAVAVGTVITLQVGNGQQVAGASYIVPLQVAFNDGSGQEIPVILVCTRDTPA